MRAKAIGLTGGIGSGKSTVAAILEDLGAVVIHADAVGHEVYRPGTGGWRQVVAAFGPDIVAPDGTIDRRRLGAIVFADAAARARLNAIVHPLIRDEIARRIEAHRRTGTATPVVVEAALLVDAGWVSLVDEVWLVVASREAVMQRLAAQRGLSPAEIAARIDAQLDDAARRRAAHHIIENVGSLDDLRARVRALWDRATAPAA